MRWAHERKTSVAKPPEVCFRVLTPKGVIHMSIRHVLRTVVVSSAATLCGGALALGVGVGVANADISNGVTTLSATTPVTAGTPYTSGQAIEIKGVANSTLSNANLVANSVPGQ